MTEIKRHSVTGYGRQDICYNEPEGEFVYYDDHAAIVAALQDRVRALAEFRGKVRDSFEMGELAEDFAVFVNIGNALRRSNCLSSIEREFFTREVPDEDYPDEMGEECDLSWGKGPTEYTEDFRKVLREIRARSVESNKWKPEVCPVTKRPFFMWIEHPSGGMVPTYGGPYDSYTIPVVDSDGEFSSERYDHDEGAWVDGVCLSERLIDDQMHVLDESEIREIRAQGADEVRDYHKVRHEALQYVDASGSRLHAESMLYALDVAARIRAGEVL